MWHIWDSCCKKSFPVSWPAVSRISSTYPLASQVDHASVVASQAPTTFCPQDGQHSLGSFLIHEEEVSYVKHPATPGRARISLSFWVRVTVLLRPGGSRLEAQKKGWVRTLRPLMPWAGNQKQVILVVILFFSLLCVMQAKYGMMVDWFVGKHFKRKQF